MTAPRPEAVAMILQWHRTLADKTARNMAEAVLRYIADPVAFDYAAEHERARELRKEAMH